MGTRPALAPPLHVVMAPESSIVRSIIESAGAGFSAVLLHDGARCYVRDYLSDAERETLLTSHSETDVIGVVGYGVPAAGGVMLHADLGPMLARLERQGLRWLLRSSRDAHPLAVSELTEDRGRGEIELCRDDDCDGHHAWLVHHRPGDGRTYWFVWHINLLSGDVVPPAAMELR